MMDTFWTNGKYEDISCQEFLNKILLLRVWIKLDQGENNLKIFCIDHGEQDRSLEAANCIQKYNSQIQHMNYLTLPAYGQNNGQKAVSSTPYNLGGHQKVLLTLVSMALAADFKRYTELISAKIVHQELGRSKTRANSHQAAPQPETISQNPPKKPQSLRNKLNEKSKPSKTIQPAKQQRPKNKSPPSQPTSKLSPQPKPTRKEVTQKVAPLKTYKKIQKEAEGKRENPGRVPRINMVSTAELSRVQLGERQKRKLRERLLIRQVKEWPVPEQGRRDRRDLRTLH